MDAEGLQGTRNSDSGEVGCSAESQESEIKQNVQLSFSQRLAVNPSWIFSIASNPVRSGRNSIRSDKIPA